MTQVYPTRQRGRERLAEQEIHVARWRPRDNSVGKANHQDGLRLFRAKAAARSPAATTG
jgi:hypothetical protein